LLQKYRLVEDKSLHEDYVLWLTLLRDHGDAYGINEPLLKYRLTDDGITGNKLKSALMTFRVYRFFNIGLFRSAFYFTSYILHGIQKHWV